MYICSHALCRLLNCPLSLHENGNSAICNDSNNERDVNCAVLRMYICLPTYVCYDMVKAQQITHHLYITVASSFT